MPSADPNHAQRPAFADTASGKIVIGLTIAAGAASISHIVTRVFFEPAPPVASITPDKIEAQAGATVEFSSAGLKIRKAARSSTAGRSAA
jgi:hypothetical protein